MPNAGVSVTQEQSSCAGDVFSRSSGELVSPGFLLCVLLLFFLPGVAGAAALFFPDGGVSTPVLRIVYTANTHGALHPCPS